MINIYHWYDYIMTVNDVLLFINMPSAAFCNAGTGLSLGLHPANEQRCYFVKTSLIGWAQA